jgi:hypothetical protein
LRCDAGFRPADRFEVFRSPAGRGRRVEGRIVEERPEYVDALRQLRTWREHADDRVAFSPEHQAAPEHGRVSAELAPPEPAVEDDDAAAAGQVLLGQEAAAEGNGHAEHRQQAITHARAANFPGFAVAEHRESAR